MTDSPNTTGSQSGRKPTSKGLGCVYGGLAVFAAGIIAAFLSGILSFVIPDTAGVVFLTIATLLPIAILVAVGIRWKAVPGFLLGIGLTIALQVVIFTGCVALIAASLGAE